MKKKLSSGITNQKFDNIYDIAIKNGALGGKISGAGSGGYGFFILSPENTKELSDRLKKIKIESQFVNIDQNGLLIFVDYD